MAGVWQQGLKYPTVQHSSSTAEKYTLPEDTEVFYDHNTYTTHVKPPKVRPYAEPSSD